VPTEGDESGDLVGDQHDPVRLVGLHRLVSATMRALGQAVGDSVDPILNSALAAIGTFSGVDRAYIFLTDPDGAHLSNTHEWCATGIAPEIANLQHVPREMADPWFEAFEDDQHVYIPSVAELDDDQAELREFLLAQDIQSLLVAPLGSGGEIHGFIGFDYVRHRADFSPADLDVLRILADTIGATLSRLRAEERAARVELVDPLTGLPNRTMFVELVDQTLALGATGPVDVRPETAGRRTARSQRRSLVGLIDLDEFAGINETFGFETGDAILVRVAERLQAALRPDDHVARVGADEFAILVDDAGDDVAVDAISSRVAAAISEPVDVDGTLATVSASIGFNVDDGTAESGAELISGAEVALRQAKGSGGARAVSFDRDSGDRIAERVNLTMRLRSPGGLDALRVAYQPAVELASGRVLGVEALARYTDADGAAVPPDVFIPVAEDAGLITALTQRIGRMVVEDVLERILPVLQGPLSVSINVSAAHLEHPEFVQDLAPYLEAAATCEPAHLWVELTESGSMVGDPQVLANLDAVAAAGVRIAIDDFGTGYSSFARLRHLPIHGIKVDQSFVRGVESDPVNQSLIRAQVDIADGLDILLLAEGCETRAEVDTLAELGVLFGQGFGLHRPMPIEDLVELLAAQEPPPG